METNFDVKTFILALVCILIGFIVGNLRGRQNGGGYQPVNPADIVDFDDEEEPKKGVDGLKMVLVIRKDLNMTKGKIAAQVGHATLANYKASQVASRDYLRRWEMQGQAKVCLKVDDEKELVNIMNAALSKNLVARVVRDAGRTQIAAGSRTVLAIGPAPISKTKFIARGPSHQARAFYRNEDFMPLISLNPSGDVAVAYGKEIDIYSLSVAQGNRKWCGRMSIHKDDLDVTSMSVSKTAVYTGDETGRLERYDLKYQSPNEAVLFATPAWSILTNHETGKHRITGILQHRDRLVTTGVDPKIRVYNPSDGSEVDALQVRTPEHKDRFTSLTTVPHTNYIAVGSTQWKANSSNSPLRLLTVTPSGLCLDKELFSHRTSVFGLSPAGSHMFASASFDGTAKLWDVRSPDPCIKTIEDADDYALFCISVDAGGRRLVFGTSHYGVIRLFDMRYLPESGNRVTRGARSVFIGGKRARSPVYSVQATDAHVYAAYANELIMVAWDGHPACQLGPET
ncbi:hypothetical protein SmJEL517_g05866 [Synchytrium microbalum]|uniref:peptidyl-tRNA hydrolase n=1 Tax=Synchytrium microbalum TaxID=1806994 RepID=A0A507BTM1_9FUNG|nr:uncharacterized protein SmJEL517_g05866 [Synchytrium microbalum]TPX30611.1 hypothetical protein SmJEL517_g05866 [Synchytrium microbalum]